MRTIVNTIACDTQPLQNLAVLRRVESLGSKKEDWARWAIERGLAMVESQLQVTAGQYCVGDTVSMADVCLVPQVYNAVRFGVDMALYPHCQRISAALSQLEPFQRAHPDRQLDAHLSDFVSKEPAK